jgi:hypothetical protein
MYIYIYIIQGALRMGFVIVLMQFQVKKLINCRALALCMNVNFVGHGQPSSLVLVYCGYSVSTDSILYMDCFFYTKAFLPGS